MAQNDIGIDLGTTTIIIAQEGTGVVLNQPSVVAVDTRKNSVLEVGDKALAMVGRTPNYISAIFPLKDGVISDHTMTRELICRFVNQVYSSHMVKPRVAVCVPAAITGIESDAVVEAVMAAGADIILLPAPGTVPGITQEYAHRLIEVVHSRGKLALTAIGTSQEGADVATIRQIALMCKMAGADIHHIGDTGVPGMALPQNIMAYSIAIRGERHTYHKMAQSVNR